MVTTYKYKKMSWIDVESPTVEEVKSLMKKIDALYIGGGRFIARRFNTQNHHRPSPAYFLLQKAKKYI